MKFVDSSSTRARRRLNVFIWGLWRTLIKDDQNAPYMPNVLALVYVAMTTCCLLRCHVNMLAWAGINLA